ncbi:hypothetical protein GCM10007885_17710 [Methylobacterium gnaphalii]|nr:hypothetical protein GCM10007885_17710 [Methylobacterium gnaphalii]
MIHGPVISERIADSSFYQPMSDIQRHTASQPRVVVAEDEPILRMYTADMLSDLGFEVLEAQHASEALDHLEASDGVVLLFTDVNMPGGKCDGFGLAQ